MSEPKPPPTYYVATVEGRPVEIDRALVDDARKYGHRSIRWMIQGRTEPATRLFDPSAGPQLVDVRYVEIAIVDLSPRWS